MKKRLIVTGLLCLLLCGCVKSPDVPATNAPAQTQDAPITPTQVTGNPLIRPTRPGLSGSILELGKKGGERRNTTAIVSNVRYITSQDQLPESDSLSQYDAAYFETGALILVLETVNSGSVLVEIESVTVSDSTASVRLSHTPQGDMGIPAMTTWLVWAEVAPGLELEWVLENPAMDSDVSRE